MKLKQSLLGSLILGASALSSQSNYGKAITQAQYDKLISDTNLVVTYKYANSPDSFPFFDYYEVYNKSTKTRDTFHIVINKHLKERCPNCGKG